MALLRSRCFFSSASFELGCLSSLFGFALELKTTFINSSETHATTYRRFLAWKSKDEFFLLLLSSFQIIRRF
jgi:hypothetical protein